MVNILKTRLSKEFREKFPDQVKKYLWKDAFWSSSYFISTTGGASIETLEQYIRDQGTEHHKRKYTKSGRYVKKRKSPIHPRPADAGTGFSREKPIKLYTGKKQIGLGLFHSKVVMRQNSDGYIYFDTKPDHLYEITDYKWTPRYKTISKGSSAMIGNSSASIGRGILSAKPHLNGFGGAGGSSNVVTTSRELPSVAMLTLRDITDNNKKVVIGIKCNNVLNLKIHEFRFASEEKEVAERRIQTEEKNIALLKQYKDLLDSGIISEEEFQTKKAQLLNK